LVNLISNKVNFADEESRKKDILGRVYEYFLSQFASQEGRKGGEFYTPRSVVRVLVEMLAPYKGRVFDPCCGSGGMFVQSEKFVEAHGGKIGDLSVYGQESNPNTFKLAKMNISQRVYKILSNYEAESNRWPRDAEFKQSWLERPIYNLLRQQRLRLLLESLERAMHTDFTEAIEIKKKLTIEHLMPQEWHKNWPLPKGKQTDELVEIRNKVIHTLGNLTLLTEKLNPSVSNSAWPIKKEKIKDDSILLLNKQLEIYKTWSEKTIKARGLELFNLAQKIWPAPTKRQV
jgi:hypothetical protein